uniref:CARD domain-containing protein n=1 Tax=Plectus sambesii TaxID=2011161 RepID=A0A914XJJ9_9BILA
MKEEHRELINKCRPRLKQSIVSSRCLDDLIDHLALRDRNGDYGLTPANIDAIRGGHHTNEAVKVGTFLEILTTRGENAFDRFISAIIASDQIGLIEILNSELPPDQHIRKQRSTPASSANAPASQPVSVQATNNQGFVATGPNSGMQVAPMHGGTQNNQLAHGNVYCGNASGQNNTFNNQNNKGSMLGGPVHGGVVVFGNYHAYPHKAGSTPAKSSAPEAAGGQSEHYNAVSVPQLGCGKAGASPAEEFDASLEMENILCKFDQMPKSKTHKLKRVLPPALVRELDNCRGLFATIEMQDVVNNYMPTVLPDSTIKKIKNAIDNSNGAYELCESLKRSSILALLTFLKGLESTKQDHFFHSFCTKAFCDDLQSILNNALQ